MNLKEMKLLWENTRSIKLFQIIRVIGEGTFGRVFEVKEIFQNKLYALKMIRAVERFIEAAKVYEFTIIFIINYI